MNPLRIDDKPGADTIYLVRSVLAFMSNAFTAMESSDIVSTDSMTGAGLIMNMCADALKDAKDDQLATEGVEQ